MGCGGVHLARMEAHRSRRDEAGFSVATWVRFLTPVVTADEGGRGKLVEEPLPQRVSRACGFPAPLSCFVPCLPQGPLTQ